MGKDNKPLDELEDGHSRISALISIIIGPLRGLGYLLVLPFVGIVDFVLLGVYRVSQSLATIRHRVSEETVEVPKKLLSNRWAETIFATPYRWT